MAPFEARNVVLSRTRMRRSCRRPPTVSTAARALGSSSMSESNSGPTTSARLCTSWRAFVTSERRARPAVTAPVRRSTPSAIATMATTSRVRSRRRVTGGSSSGGRRSRCLEPVADAPHGRDHDAVTELLANLRDVHIDGASVAEPVVAPHAVEDLLARQREAGALGEEAQQVELLGGELDRRIVDQHLAPADVDRDRARLYDLGRRASVDTPQHRLHPGDQLGRGERLGEVVVAAELETEDAV